MFICDKRNVQDKTPLVVSSALLRSTNEKEGDILQARAITCRHVSSKTRQLTTITEIAVSMTHFSVVSTD